MRHLFEALAAASLIISMAGCAAQAPKREEVFFPAAPSLPRIQYLASFTGIRDIRQQSGFDFFVIGEEPKVGVDKPYGVAIYDGKIYVCDTNSTVVVFDFKKKTFEPMAGGVGGGRGKLLQPTNISIDKNGNKYVTDIARGQVVIFDRNDAFVRAVGVPGAWKPTDAVVYEDRLYVADAKNSDVAVFDMQTFEIIKRIGRSDKEKVTILPTNLAFDQNGYLYVSDTLRFQVLKFDRDGHLLDTLGRLGSNTGSFARPKGIAVDRENRLYVVDAAFNNVQMFDGKGRLLTYWGGPGPKGGYLQLPATVTIDYDNLGYFKQYISPRFDAEFLVIVTSQFGPNRVNVFAFGKEKGVNYPTEEEDLEKVRKAVKQYLEKNPEKSGQEDRPGAAEPANPQ